MHRRMAHSLPTPNLPRVPLRCPECGKPMNVIQTEWAGGLLTYYVCSCPEHGTFHFNDTKPLTAGLPE